jgi:hypothetical protein
MLKIISPEGDRPELNRHMKALAVAGLLSLGMAVAACSSPSQGDNVPRMPSSGLSVQAPVNGMVQSHNGGNVAIDVKWQGVSGQYLVFDVAMNTHYVDLDQYDLGRLSTLSDDSGTELRPVSWNAAPGGHHRRGRLTFPIPDSLVRGTATHVKLMVRDVAGVGARVFQWQLAN